MTPFYKRGVFALLFFSLSLLADNIPYYKHDFREENAIFYLKGSFYPKTNRLALDTFEKEWDVLPQFKQNNIAYGTLYGDVHYNIESWKIGAFYENGMFLSFNKGFGETWYKTNKDFNTLLHFQNINTQLESTQISGKGLYYKIGGLFVYKYFKPVDNHYIGMKLKVFGSDEVQDIKLSGLNTQQRFIGAFDYWYKQKNYISKRDVTADAPNGYGYSVDLEYIYSNEFLYLYGGVMNVTGKIYYDSATKMHYDFDSQTTYRGQDGYNHRRPFGKGYYKDQHYSINMPIYYRGVLDIAPKSSFSIGDNMEGYKDAVFNELYLTVQPLSFIRLKTGYIYEAKTAVFGVYLKHFSMEISNNFSFSQQVLQANVHVWF